MVLAVCLCLQGRKVMLGMRSLIALKGRFNFIEKHYFLECYPFVCGFFLIKDGIKTTIGLQITTHRRMQPCSGTRSENSFLTRPGSIALPSPKSVAHAAAHYKEVPHVPHPMYIIMQLFIRRIHWPRFSLATKHLQSAVYQILRGQQQHTRPQACLKLPLQRT